MNIILISSVCCVLLACKQNSASSVKTQECNDATTNTAKANQDINDQWGQFTTKCPASDPTLHTAEQGTPNFGDGVLPAMTAGGVKDYSAMLANTEECQQNYDKLQKTTEEGNSHNEKMNGACNKSDDKAASKTPKIHGFSVRMKSYIAPIGSSVGFGGNNTKALAFAKVTDQSFSETQQSFPGRFTTSWGSEITCSGGKVTAVNESRRPVIVPGIEPKDPGPFNLTATATNDFAKSSIQNGRAWVMIKSSAAPPAVAEPSFNLIQERTCNRIWHQMVMVFSCDKNDNAVFEGAKVQGSAFPTHSFDISIQEGGSASATLNNKVIEQGLLEDLWKCSNFAEVKERIGGGECIKNCPKP